MKMRKLGGQGLLVSEMGLGCMGMDHGYGKPVDRQAMTTLIHKAIELGCNLFDTAPIYGFENEELLGNALKDHRKNVVIATKFGVLDMALVDGQPVPVFMLLTAYDTQKLRQIYAYYAGDAELAEKASIYGALTLYLDFINIFLYVVRLLGMNSRSRNN